MKVFNTFFKITRRNLSMIMIYFVIFIVLTVVLTNVGNQSDVTGFAESKTNVAIIDEDGSALSEGLTALLGEKHTVVEVENDAQVITDALYNRKIEYMITIPEGYEQSFLGSDSIPKLQTQSVPGSYTDVYIARLLDSYLNTVKTYTSLGVSLDSALADANADMLKSADVVYKHEVTEQQDGIFYFYNYQAYTILMLIIFGVGAVMIAFSRKPLEMRMNASALSLTRRNAETGLGMMVMAGVILVIFLLFGLLMYGADMFSSGSMICFLNSVCYMVFSVALAFLIGMLAKSMNVLSAVANALGLALSFIGGVFVPREIMGDQISNIAKFTPTYWYTDVVDKVAGTGGLDTQLTGDMAASMGIQLLFAVAIMAIALVVSKQKRKMA